jgi:pimeloyl-ACP methyl ester carboxylesterase
MAAQTMTLRDGRTFAFHEYGDAAGFPVMFTTGTPVSGELGIAYDEDALKAGLRWISIDKPGYGLSSYDPKRSLSRYADDVRELADHLGIERFAAVGESGGGPHVYAIGRYLPDRVTTIVSVSGLGPAHEAWVRKAMIPFNKRLFWMARNAPWLMSLTMAPFARAFRPGQPQSKRDAVLAKVIEQMAPQDRAVLEANPDGIPMLLDAIAGGYAQGAKAAVQEYRLFATPWEFRLEDITVPTHIWHGTEDNNVPIAVARHIATLIPHVTTHYIEGGGHAAISGHYDEVMAAILAAN